MKTKKTILSTIVFFILSVANVAAGVFYNITGYGAVGDGVTNNTMPSIGLLMRQPKMAAALFSFRQANIFRLPFT